VVLAGSHVADASGTALGAPVPTTAVPAWGNATPNNESALIARLRGERLGAPSDAVYANGFE
jgi:hypothetical protein